MSAPVIHALLRGGPADGRLYVVRDLREIRVQQAEPLPARFWDELESGIDFPTVPYTTVTYQPARILAEFTPGGIL